MTATYDPTTDAGKVRLLIHDTDDDDALFTDEEVDAALDFEGGSVRRAAAFLASSLASNAAMLSRIVKRGDMEEDTTKVAASYTKLSEALYARADADDSATIMEDIATPNYWERNLDYVTDLGE